MGNVGKTLKAARKQRGLTQGELAKASGVSISIIRKLEQGDRATARMETLRMLAAALQVTTTQLMNGPKAEGPVVGTEERWEAVRSALVLPPPPRELDDEPPTIAGVKRALDDSVPLFAKDKFGELSTVLPGMLRDADALGTEGRSIRARLLQLSGWLMVATRQFDLADVALQRAMDGAADPMDGAATANIKCWLLLRQGKLESALNLAVEWADEIEPRPSRATPAELSTWGWMLLRLSAAAVRNQEPDTAEHAMRLAQGAAVMLGREHTPENDFLMTFGPTTVKLKTAENASVTNRPDVVLRLAQKIPVSTLRATSNNRNRHLLDVADAYVKTGEYAEAFDKLSEIRASSPEWLPNQTYARTVMRRIVEGRRTLTSEMRDMATAIHLDL
ncbi:helix-turn-helix domain-containing protein [Streptomyces sp. 5-10]|uniref:helix-turn-helix domain-containing protein n=1 Tax=Streptomyces sp. 5-10 TaxID=878925 RepID=UPI00168B1283|nr:helix-turn-helix transcriptional regulator [Streptomyces sp. 5-10]MBD3005707.1 helix-turn-helix transcriptional regulator [Streptomyces sp. 5-10]